MNHHAREELRTSNGKFPILYIDIKDSCERYRISRAALNNLLDNPIETIKRGRRRLLVIASADAYFASLSCSKRKPAAKELEAANDQ